MTPPTDMFAQGSAADPLQGFFQSLQSALHPDRLGSPGVLLTVGFVGGIIALLLGLAFLRSRRQEAIATPSAGRPTRLLARTLREMGVGLHDRLLMRVIAAKVRLRQPAVMLFSPVLFDQHTLPWANNLKVAFLRRLVRARLKIVAAKAFD